MPRALLLLTAILASVDLSAQQGKGFANKPGGNAKPVKSDIPFIKCAVCEVLAKHAYRDVKAMRDTLPPGGSLREIDILEHIEAMGKHTKDAGEWITKLDLVEDGRSLKVVEMDEFGKCGTECMTVERVVEDLLGSHDTDIAEVLWTGKETRAQFSNWLCRQASSACRTKPPPLPKDRKPGPAFEEADPQEAQLNKMLQNMQDMGMGGQVYNREQAMQKYMGGYGSEDEDDDEDEEPGAEDWQMKAAMDKRSVSASSAGAASAQRSPERMWEKAAGVAQDVLGKAKAGIGKAYDAAQDIIDKFANVPKPPTFQKAEL